MQAKSIIAVAVVLVVLFTVSILSGEPSRSLARHEAQRAFLESRSGTPGSYSFVTRGLQAEMCEEQVDALLLPCDKVMRHMPDRSETNRWEGFVNVYVYQFGVWSHPILGTEENLGKEVLWVYFDQHARAQKVQYWLSGAISTYYPASSSVEYDLVGPVL